MNDNQTNYTNHYMVSFEKAFQLIDEVAKPLSIETVKTTQIRNRILAEDVLSPISIPPFDNSAMDGYAISSCDLVGASIDSPIQLKLAGLTAAGDEPSEVEHPHKTAWKIMTGAPVPAGYNAIIPVENTKLSNDGNTVSCFSEAVVNAHIRASGEDFIQGDLVLKKQTQINANKIMALASLGISKIKVVVKPKVAVFSTGKELVDDPEQPLKNGQIHNSNMPYILEYLKDLPVDAYNAGTNYDDVDAYQLALQKQLDASANIIISTGAVSMGDFDFIPQTIIKMGGEILFHKVSIRPGKPILFAQFPNGCYYFGLPGNPISATIGLRFFVSHLISLLLNMPRERPLKSKLKSQRSKKKGFTNILKADARIDENASLVSDILNGQESFKIHPLIDANGWLVLDSERESIDAQELTDFYPSCIDYNQTALYSSIKVE